VVKVRNNRLKAITVIPDVCTILYFYLHGRMHIPADFAPVIIAAYSGLIIYCPGRTVGERLTFDSELTANRCRTSGAGNADLPLPAAHPSKPEGGNAPAA
jgi:hypothetical protein